MKIPAPLAPQRGGARGRSVAQPPPLLVKMRTGTKNGLQALALSRNMCRGEAVDGRPSAGATGFATWGRGGVPATRLAGVARSVGWLGGWVGQAGSGSEKAAGGETPADVSWGGTADGLVVLGQVERFANGRKVVKKRSAAEPQPKTFRIKLFSSRLSMCRRPLFMRFRRKTANNSC